jgi:DNA-binding Lrp family transcriptional regulator
MATFTASAKEYRNRIRPSDTLRERTKEDLRRGKYGDDVADVVKSLEKVKGVSEAHSSHGMYDAVAIVQANSFGEVKEIVSKHIRGLDNVKSTLTLTLVESPTI